MKDVRFLLKALELKDERRTGPQLYNIEDPETVAGHSWSTALLVLIYGDEVDVDVDRCLKMAIVHDLAEAETGDFLTRAKEKDLNYDQKEKEGLEEEFWDNYSEELGEDLRSIWEEYEERGTEEAIFVKDMDLLDLCFTALKYERQERYDPGENTERPYRHLDEFFESAKPRLKTDLGKEVFQKLLENYEDAKEGNTKVEDENVEFVLSALHLKDEKRTGWALRGVETPETVASHSWGSALQVLLNNHSLDSEKLLKMALVHDLEQAEAGDIPSRGDEERKVMSTGEKVQKEVNAMENLVPNKLESIFELWNEHMEMETEGAQFVEDMEQVDMVLQALKYEKGSRYSPEDSEFSRYERRDEFFISADENIQTEKGKELFKKIREKYRKVKEE